ncbi:DegV family protein [Lactococcus fujiensis]|uniref:DegV family protein n=1 Tax=Lactococcus fujiensis TaxID=610251 RepID=UPI000B05BEB0|nr:DegV family protein [Lactococcus fujiensis]
MKLAIVTDTSADIAETYKTRADLFVLEIPISIDGVDYEPSKMKAEAWFDLMKTSKDAPKTSQPSVAELAILLKTLEKKGYTHVLGLFLPSGISGFYANAFYLQSEYNNMKVEFPETFITARPLGYMVETALDGIDAGKTFDEIKATFEYQRDHDTAFMLVDDLKWLAKGGRLSNASAFVGTLMNIKPLLQFSEEGEVVVYDKVRTTKKSHRGNEEVIVGTDTRWGLQGLCFEYGDTRSCSRAI